MKFFKKLKKKHYILCEIAILLTGVFLYLTSSLWINKGIRVSFDAIAEKDITYQVFYTEKNGQKYTEKRSIKKAIKSGEHKIEFLIPAKIVKRLRIDIGSRPGTVQLSNIQLEGIRNMKLDYNKFNKHQIDSYKIVENKIILSSSEKDPFLIYKNELDLVCSTKVDWHLLIIFSILAFLLMYKFVFYVSKFKIEKNHSKSAKEDEKTTNLNEISDTSDIVMLVVFFMLLFIPMLHISDTKKSNEENRMLASKPSFTINNWGDYGSQFDTWYNDHFYGRNAMIYLYNYIKFYISPQGFNQNAMIGKNGFLWGKNYNAVDMFRNANLFTDEELKIAGDHIDKFVKDAQKAGIKNIYFMLSNDKESMYPEYYPSYIKKQGNISRLQQLLDYIHLNYPKIKFLNFRDKFENIKKEDIVFCKTGTHMNDIGAYYEYYFLVNEIKKDFPDLDVLTLDDFNIEISDDINQPSLDKDIYAKFFILPKYQRKNFENKIFSFKNKINTKQISSRKKHNLFIRGTNKYAPNKLSIFNIGDSFAGRYYKYLSATFHKADRVFIGWGKPFVLYPNEVKYLHNNIPDILVISTTERFLQRFLTLEFPKYPNSKD